MEENLESSGKSITSGRITIYRMDKVESSFYHKDVHKAIDLIKEHGCWDNRGDETIYIPFHAITKIHIREDEITPSEKVMYEAFNN
jgi:hypothetical protein